MSKTLTFYRDGIRELREQGYDFASASNGYYLRGDLSSGQKAAISRALNEIAEERAERDRDEAEKREHERETESADDEDFQDSGWYDEAIEEGDWDDIDWFDYDYIDDFTDEEADSYDEGDAK